MLPDRVLNPGPLTYESGALPIALRSPAKTGHVMSCPPSVLLCVCLSVSFLCSLHNSDTIQDIFMKLGTNINHHQPMCREQELILHLHFLQNNGPLKFFL